MDRQKWRGFICASYAVFWHLVFTGPIAAQHLRVVDYNTAGGPREGFATVMEAIGTENVDGIFEFLLGLRIGSQFVYCGLVTGNQVGLENRLPNVLIPRVVHGA